MTRTPGSCSDCSEWQPKLSRGRCARCYARWHRAQNKAGTFVRLETKQSPLERLKAKAQPQSNGCTLWVGHVSEEGYGKIAIDGRMHLTHRAAYELLIGPIPEGAWIDHACHNRDQSCMGGNSCLHRRCVNPEHLEPVTAHENQHRSPHTNASKEACRNGHIYDEENTYIRPDTGARMCRTCRKRVSHA